MRFSDVILSVGVVGLAVAEPSPTDSAVRAVCSVVDTTTNPRYECTPRSLTTTVHPVVATTVTPIVTKTVIIPKPSSAASRRYNVPGLFMLPHRILGLMAAAQPADAEKATKTAEPVMTTETVTQTANEVVVSRTIYPETVSFLGTSSTVTGETQTVTFTGPPQTTTATVTPVFTGSIPFGITPPTRFPDQDVNLQEPRSASATLTSVPTVYTKTETISESRSVSATPSSIPAVYTPVKTETISESQSQPTGEIPEVVLWSPVLTLTPSEPTVTPIQTETTTATRTATRTASETAFSGIAVLATARASRSVQSPKVLGYLKSLFKWW